MVNEKAPFSPTGVTQQHYYRLVDPYSRDARREHRRRPPLKLVSATRASVGRVRVGAQDGSSTRARSTDVSQTCGGEVTNLSGLPLSNEAWKTIRMALESWGRTLRLVVILTTSAFVTALSISLAWPS